MKTKDVKYIAKEWVRKQFQEFPDFSAAFFHGSINWTNEEDLFPATSDVDIIIVTAAGKHEPGKIFYGNIILDISFLHETELRTPEQILSTYYLAGDFRKPAIIADRSGDLEKLQAVVEKEFTKKQWVEKRCDDASQNVHRYFKLFDEAVFFHDQVTNWLFSRGVMTHIILSAGLKNPTVRRRYVDAKFLLVKYGQSDFYSHLLALSGFDRISPTRAIYHLEMLSMVFNVAISVMKTPYRFSSDITNNGKRIAIEGSKELISAGMHQESIFWIVACFARCMHVIMQDAPVGIQKDCQTKFNELISDLGFHSRGELCDSNIKAKAFLQVVNHVAAKLIAQNPDIRN